MLSEERIQAIEKVLIEIKLKKRKKYSALVKNIKTQIEKEASNE